jgi:hypothetical protein
MGLGGFQGAYGLQGLDDVLAQRRAAKLAEQARQDKLAQLATDNDYRNRALAQTESLRQDALGLQKQNQANLDADRVFKENISLAEGIHPGGDYMEDNPITGRLRSVGAAQKTSGGQTLGSTQFAQALTPGESAPSSGGVLRTASPGVADASIPNHYTKVETQKQYDTRTDNERQAAQTAATAAQAQATLAQTAKRDADTAAYRQGMLNKPTNPSFQFIQTDQGWALGDKRTGAVKPTTTPGGGPAQPNLSATERTRLAQAQAVNQTGNDMIARLRDPRFASQFGPVIGRYNTLEDFIGNPPPEFAELAGQIHSYALANMGIHGMRSAEGAEHLKKLFDAHHTPESLIAAIQGLGAYGQHLLQNAGRNTGGNAAAPPPATTAPAGPPSSIADLLNRARQ